MLTALAIAFAFGSMIIIHEFGHYIVAKWVGVKVIEFSIGFGPKIISYQGKDTLYTLRIIPLGGFVKLYGMDPEIDDNGNAIVASNHDPRSFMNKTVLQRMAVIAAGPIMNFFLAAILFICVFAYLGIPTAGTANIVGSVVAEKPAAAAGIQPGDKILAVNNEPTPEWMRLTEVIHANPDQVLSITVERADGTQQQTVTVKTEKDAQTGYGMIGIAPEVFYTHASIWQATRLGLERTVDFTKYVIVAIVQMITGKIPADVGGPVMIVKVIGDAAHQGLSDLLGLTGILSIQIGLLNLFPIPALDGSRLIFLSIEGIRGKPINPVNENMIHFVGFVLLMALMVFVTYKDVLRLFVKVG
jgi:regulator of sigma E protease